VHQALDCLVKGQNCGGYSLRGGASPGFRGLMTWSINWDHYYNWEFQNNRAPYLDALPLVRFANQPLANRTKACGLPIPVCGLPLV
jgi:hypothetical protein